MENPKDKRGKLLKLMEYAGRKRNEFTALADFIEKEMADGLSETEAEALSELLLKVIQKHNTGGKA